MNQIMEKLVQHLIDNNFRNKHIFPKVQTIVRSPEASEETRSFPARAQTMVL